VQTTKEKLGFKAKGLEVIGGDGSYKLEESPPFTSKKKLFLSDKTINCKGYGQSITTANSSYALH
jgi:hypothetical protein